ncbi:hypothetical protein [Desulfoscipio geothermicus]|uniref:Uncharacterized protein n=1 Tax=Desulfoscipio geothermicus DSM 3669 TaxID=1121426 RepID=A0A1I6DG67_9FIRM|nr:hypothetical protein [Desulfoscipio geothermicus]SFR04429.1 hypothetical protein SAMN05660706_11067 [Desulfoscipio geothermicus DSM 3669]
MKKYHVCDCCDRIFNITESADRGDAGHLTGAMAGDIMIEEFENDGSLVPGLCAECREEVYGPAQQFIYPHRLH